MQELIRDFIGHRVWAVVGASRNPAKYGYKIVRDLSSAGYRVYPVNRKGGEVAGIPVYRSLRELPEKPEVVDIVVPPEVTEEVVKECKELGLTRIWMQPGAESEEAIRYCQENGLQVVYGVCAMLNKKIWEA